MKVRDRVLPETPPAAAQPGTHEGSDRRAWRVCRADFGRWMMERVKLDQAGNEIREVSATYRDRAQAEEALVRAMRQEPFRRSAGS